MNVYCWILIIVLIMLVGLWIKLSFKLVIVYVFENLLMIMVCGLKVVGDRKGLL